MGSWTSFVRVESFFISRLKSRLKDQEIELKELSNGGTHLVLGQPGFKFEGDIVLIVLKLCNEWKALMWLKFHQILHAYVF